MNKNNRYSIFHFQVLFLLISLFWSPNTFANPLGRCVKTLAQLVRPGRMQCFVTGVAIGHYTSPDFSLLNRFPSVKEKLDGALKDYILPHINSPTVYRYNTLRWAIEYGEVEVANTLIDSFVRNEILTLEKEGEQSLLHLAIENNLPFLAVNLLEAGFRGDLPNNDGVTPFELAIKFGMDEVALLIKNSS